MANTAKRKNAADLTGRNNIARKAEHIKLRGVVMNLKKRVETLERQVRALAAIYSPADQRNGQD